MKILHTVESYDPSVGGMQEVVKQLSERLVTLGHSVHVATSKRPGRASVTLNGVTIDEFSLSGNMVCGIDGGSEETKRYEEYLIKGDFDVIANFAAQQWATDLMLPILDRIKAKKVFVPTGFSALANQNYFGYFENMKSWMKKYDANVFLSNGYRDIDFAREHGVGNIVIIPNGAGEDEFLDENGVKNIRQRLHIPKDHFLILHVGSHTGGKGHREAMQIIEKARIRKVTFLLVANYENKAALGRPKRLIRSGSELNCPDLCLAKETRFNRLLCALKSRKRVMIRSLSRPETVAAFKEADLFLFPSNIECSPLVLFECLASKTPFLTTDVGNAAEIVEWSGGGIVLPTLKSQDGTVKADIEGSARMLEDLYGQPATREKMKQAGFAAWRKHFTWEEITMEYERLYTGLLSSPIESAPLRDR
jgi:glycosyltransferase involved in cell wall biosynthesis